MFTVHTPPEELKYTTPVILDCGLMFEHPASSKSSVTDGRPNRTKQSCVFKYLLRNVGGILASRLFCHTKEISHHCYVIQIQFQVLYAISHFRYIKIQLGSEAYGHSVSFVCALKASLPS